MPKNTIEERLLKLFIRHGNIVPSPLLDDVHIIITSEVQKAQIETVEQIKTKLGLWHPDTDLSDYGWIIASINKFTQSLSQ